MKKIVFTLLTALILLPASSQSARRNHPPPPADSIAETRKRYPDADLLLVDQVNRIRYETDGTYRYSSDTEFSILTEKGRQERSVIRAYYNAAYGAVRFDQAEIVKHDGRVVPVDVAAQSREAVETRQMSANIFDPNQRVIILTVPGLEIGDTLRYSVSGERTKTVVPGTWSDYFSFEAPWPILRAVYKIDAPADLPLIHRRIKDEIPGTVSFHRELAGGRILYRWEANDVPQMFEEPRMPPRHTVGQRLLLSTISDWESLSRWYWNLSLPRLEAVNDAMKEKVRELTEGVEGRQEKINALFRFVSQDIRYMGITIEDEAPGYEPHDVSLTFSNRYGVCRDKAALLAAMLNLAGFEARPVLIYVGPKKDPDVPQPWFNHAITAVRNEDGGWQLMDPTDENTRDPMPAYLSDRSYLTATPEGERLQISPVTPPEENGLSIHTDAVLSDCNTIRAETVLRFDGIHDTLYRGRLARMKPHERLPFFEERLKQAFGSVRLYETDITPPSVRDVTVPLEVVLRFEIENAAAETPRKAVLKMPFLSEQFGLFNRMITDGTGLDERRFPLQVQVTCGIEETVRLDPGKRGLVPDFLPEYEDIQSPELIIQREIGEEDGVIIARTSLLLNTVEFDPDQYSVLKESLRIHEQNEQRGILLARRDFPPEADLAVLEEQVVYTLAGPDRWVEDRFVRTKVLTYAGTKEAADLRIPYNPALCQVRIVSASVTSPDGTVKEIDPATEINLMDPKWTAEAPRYPEGKILVANLPAVEPGSLIETRVARFCEGRPFFSAVESFRGFHPIVSKTVRIRAPHSLTLSHLTTDPESVRPQIRHEGGLTVYEWTAGEHSIIRKEESLPPNWVVAPSLLLSCGDLQGYSEEVHQVLRRAAEPGRALRRTARELTDGLRNRTDKISALRDFADRNVRDAGPAFFELPLDAVTPAERVLSEGYGNTADRAVLLYALLDAARLKPRFILSTSLPRGSSEKTPLLLSPQFTLFDTVLVAVENEEKETVYLGDTGQYAQLGSLQGTGRPAFDLDTGEMIWPQALVSDQTETEYVISIHEDGDALLTRRTVFSGKFYEAFHKQFSEFTPEQKRREYQHLLSRLSRSARPESDLTTAFDEGLLSFTAALPSFAVRSGNRLHFSLPDSLEDVLPLQASRRENPFHIEHPADRLLMYDIVLPDGWEPLIVPDSFSLNLPVNSGFAFSRTALEKNRLRIVERIRLLPSIIPAEEYGQLLVLKKHLTAPPSRTVLLQKREDPVSTREREDPGRLLP